MSVMESVKTNCLKAKHFFDKIKIKRIGYRYTLINVSSGSENAVTLFVLVTGIKKHILKFKPEDIVSDDELLSEFSPCDVRAITYLSFQKYIRHEKVSLRVDGQLINNGLTSFNIFDFETNENLLIDAKSLYQNYDYLTRLDRKDMLSVISTAVQEQTILEIKKIGGI